MIADGMVLAPGRSSEIIDCLVRVIGKNRNGEIALFKLVRTPRGELQAPFFVSENALNAEIGSGAILDNQLFQIEGLPTSFSEVKPFRQRKNGSFEDNPTYLRLKKHLRAMAPLLGNLQLDTKPQTAPVEEVTHPDRLVSDESLLDPVERAILIRSTSKLSGISEKTIGRLLYLWWFAGKTFLALIPNLAGCGPKGQRQKAHHKKRGAKRRPRITNTEHLRGKETAVTPTIRTQAISHLTEYKGSSKRGLRRCYEDYISRTYNKGYVYKPGTGVVPIIDYGREMPSFGQYRRIYETARDAGELGRQVPKSKRRKKKQSNGKGGRHAIRGPCHVFQIDWTGIQLALRSIFDSNVSIGQAVLYLVVDVWSTAIVGFYLVLAKTPTFAMARRALLHAFSDKVAACAEAGVQIEPDDWYSFHLCLSLLADNGELAGNISDALPDELKTRESFTRGKTPEDHGIVERLNGILKAGPLSEIPGAWRKKGSFRDTDPRHEGVLTLRALRKYIILAILDHNKMPVPPDLIPPEYLAAGRTNVSRMALHRWGLEELNSLARVVDKQIVYASLLDQGQAEVRPDGIYFKWKDRTTCYRDGGPTSMALQASALKHGDFVTDVRFDEMASGRIMVKDQSAKQWAYVAAADKDLKEHNASFSEAALLMQAKAEVLDATRAANRAEQFALRNEASGLIADYKRVAKHADDGRSKSKRKQTDLRARQVEKLLEMEAENISLNKTIGEELKSVPSVEPSTTKSSSNPTLRELKAQHAARVRDMPNK